jgi:hypothetical protein
MLKYYFPLIESSSSDEDNAPGKVPPPPRLNQVRHHMLNRPGVSVDAFSPQSGKQTILFLT